MAFSTLDGHQFVVLTTHRKDGTPVPTTVWFAHHGEGIVVGTSAGTGKVKRIRRDGTVTVVPSTYRGRPKSDEPVRGQARVLADDEAGPARSALAAKYGIQWRLFGRNVDTMLEIVPAG